VGKQRQYFSDFTLCIGIGGVSRSGKSYLAKMLHSVIPESTIIHQDLYIPHENRIAKINGHTDWEQPGAIDWAGYASAITEAQKKFKCVIAEGLLAFYNPEINKLYTKIIFIEIDKSTFTELKRKDLRWGAEPDWYIEHIWKSYLIYGQMPQTSLNQLTINGNINFDLPYILKFLATQ